jgi:hypothetical protein
MRSYCNKEVGRCGRKRYRKSGKCFPFRNSQYPNGPQEFFDSFPEFVFELPTVNGTLYKYTWKASEYLYKKGGKTEFCFAFYPQRYDKIIMMGGTFMRQHGFIFDVDSGKLGIAKASCGGSPFH